VGALWRLDLYIMASSTVFLKINYSVQVDCKRWYSMEQLSQYNDWAIGWTTQGFIPGMCGSFSSSCRCCGHCPPL